MRRFNFTRFASEGVPAAKRPNPANISPGRWMTLGEINFDLDQLALNTGAEVPIETIKAVPDPWAHPRAFAVALLDDGHAMHKNFLGQWRWLLAVLALSEERKHDFRLKLTAVNLGGDHPLDSLLTGLRPRKHAWGADAHEGQKTGWEKVGLISVRESNVDNYKVIGILNPASIVSTGRRFSEHRSTTGIAWVDGAINDPLKNLSGEERRLVWRYVTLLRKNLSAALGSTYADNRITNWGILSKRLKDFAKALSNDSCSTWQAEDFDLQNPAKPNFMHTEAPDQSLPALYRPLLNRPFKKYDGEVHTDCRIGQTQMILLDRSLEGTLGKPASQIRVWKQVMLSAALTDRSVIEEDPEFASEGFRLVEPHDLLLAKVFNLASTSKLQLKWHHQSLRSATLPITPLVLSIYGRDELAKALKLEDDEVVLQVPIGTTDGQTHRLKCRVSQQVVAFDNDEISLWPNFRHPAWDEYHVRLKTNATNGQLNIAPYAAAAWNEASSMGWTPPKKTGKVIQSDMPFDVVLCAAAMLDEAGGETLKAEPAGIIVLQDLDKLPPDLAATARVAVDFGTTGTIAAFATGEHQPQIETIEIHDRVVQPLQPKGADTNPRVRASLLLNYFPGSFRGDAQVQRLPALSAWRKDAIWDGNGQGGMPLFLADVNNDEVPSILRFLGPVQTDLKWNSDLRKVAADYLSRLSTMIRAELMAKGLAPESWKFSYPRALKNEEEGKLAEQFEESVRGIFAGNENVEVQFTTEDLACAFSAFVRNADRQTTIVLDIGGGTTDVSILQQRDDGGYDWNWLGSLKLAGMSFFTQTLGRSPELLAWLGLQSWNAVYNGATGVDQRFRLELLMNGDALDKALDDRWHWRNQEKDKKVKAAAERLEAATTCFMAGISWYLGRVCHASNAVDSSKLGSVSFVLCGRGARFPLRLHERSKRFNKSLMLFHKACGVEGDCVVDGNLEAVKQEVVTGALSQDRFDAAVLSTDTEHADTTPYHGLTVKGVAAPDRVSARNGPTTIPTIEAAGFTEFLNQLGSVVGLKYEISDIEEQLRTLTSQVENDVTKEPAFIVALRWLVQATGTGDKSVSWSFAS